jgi:hypothetical protein
LPATGAGWTVALENDKGERKASGSLLHTPTTSSSTSLTRRSGPCCARPVVGKTTDGDKIAAVLGVNVLDRRWAAGHFLVEATEYIARFLVDLAVLPEGDAAPAEPDITYWKRRVVQSCIYGVDLKPACRGPRQTALWLSTLAGDRPLSFWTIICAPGNALVGARLDELARVREGGASTAK